MIPNHALRRARERGDSPERLLLVNLELMLGQLVAGNAATPALPPPFANGSVSCLAWTWKR